jgi:hypothetical protein
MELECKPDFETAMKRIYAWFEQALIDRPPVRFSAHNAEYTSSRALQGRSWPDIKSKWMDAEFQLEYFMESIQGQTFLAETFPVFWPNLGPEIFSALYGGHLVFQEVTSYYEPSLRDWSEMDNLLLDKENPYWKKLEEMTFLALQQCPGKFLVGYSDLHGGVDCAAAWRDPQQFCMDLICSPQQAKALINKAAADFFTVYDHFDEILKSHGQPSVTWMAIPTFGRMHIPSCDFASLISTEHFVEFCLPITVQEVQHTTHNVFHVDGKGVAKNLDYLLQIPEIQAFQYVQGVGDDQAIMQWLPQLKKIQNAGKSLVIDLQLTELEDFIAAMRPEGVLLCLAVEPESQPEVLKRITKW